MATLTEGASGCLRLAGQLNDIEIRKVRSLGDKLIAKAGEGSRVQLDVSGLETVNSTVLSLLLVWLKQASEHGQELVIKGMPDKLFDIARVSGLETVFSIER